MPSVSKRAQKVIASPIRKFLPLVLDAQNRGVEVFRLNVGDPDLETPKVIFETIKKYNKKTLAYAPSPGIKEHTAAWVKYYSNFGVNLKAENIVPTVGGAEGILLALMAISDSGDEIIVFEPLYTSYKGFAAMCNIKLVPITLKIENNFSLPNDSEIEKKITKKTKAIVIINPNNPTGTVWTKKELLNLINISNKHNLFIISDETYREIVFKNKPLCLLQFKAAKKNVIIIDSVSKRFSCPGARLGCVVSYNKDVMWSILKFAMIRLSVPTLEQYGLIPLLNNSIPYTNKITAEYKKRRDIVYSELNKIDDVVCKEPQGAFYLIAKLPINDSEDFVKFLLNDFDHNKKTVMVTPAKDFYITKNLGKNQIRIAYVLKPALLKEAMKILSLGLKKYLKVNF